MTDRRSASHADHDLLLVSALAAGDLDVADRTRAEGLVETCPDCSLLLADLRALATAVASMPAPRRTRDFGLRPEDARRLGRRGWRGLVTALGGPRFGAMRPLAAGLTTLGLAGLLLAALPSIPLGMGSAAGPTILTPVGAPLAPSGPLDVAGEGAGSPAASVAPGRNQYATQSDDPRLEPVPASKPQPSTEGDIAGGLGRTSTNSDESAALEVARPAGPSPLVVLSATFLVLGLCLFAIRWTARRLTSR